MNKSLVIEINLKELSYSLSESADTIIEMVEHGIVEPEGNIPENWKFNTQMITITQKALRLHKDLDIEWQGIALALSLIEEVELLREQNKNLQRRLNRFLINE